MPRKSPHGKSRMKILALFLAFFSLAFYLFGNEEVRGYRAHRQIAGSPGFAPAIYEGTTKLQDKRKGHDSYWVNYKYQVGDSTYRVSTSKTDEEGVKFYVGAAQQVAYDTRAPSVGVLKRYYDLRRPGETLAQVLLVVGVLCAGIALPLSLFVAWCLGWLRRKGKAPTSSGGSKALPATLRS